MVLHETAHGGVAGQNTELGALAAHGDEVIVHELVAPTRVLAAQGIGLVSGGTDTHLVLLDLTGLGLTGQQAQDRLDAVNITTNKNPIPFDATNPGQWVGLRLGTAAATTRGFDRPEFEHLARTIAAVLISTGDAATQASARDTVAGLCQRFPIYPR